MSTAVYVESSALLTWVFSQKRAAEVRAVLEQADEVVTSALTLLEAERALHRARASGILPPGEIRRVDGLLLDLTSTWAILDVSTGVLRRAGQTFPVEPVRSLDAIHLASLVLLIPERPDLKVLSLDRRIRDNARALGLDLLP